MQRGPLVVLLDVRRGWEGLLLGSSARVERRIRNRGLSVRSRWLAGSQGSLPNIPNIGNIQS